MNALNNKTDRDLFIGVGCMQAQRLPFEVLKFSILNRTSNRCLTIEPLYQARIIIPIPRDSCNRQKTPFSFQRFIIPEICDYRGRAIYFDSDMLVLADVSALTEIEFRNADVLAVPGEFSVLVLDCANLRWDIRELVTALDDGRLSYDSLMSGRGVSNISYVLPKAWNWLDNCGREPPHDTRLIHYTVTDTQPWISSGHPLGSLWLTELFRAIDTGAISHEFVEENVERGFVRPSLLFQVDHRVTVKRDVPRSVLAEDEGFSEYCRRVNYCIMDGYRP